MGGRLTVCFVEQCNSCCQALFMLLVVALVVLSGSFFFPPFSLFFLFCPPVTPNMHGSAPDHNTVGTLPQSASCNLRAAAKSKCSLWKKQHSTVCVAPKPCLLISFFSDLRPRSLLHRPLLLVFPHNSFISRSQLRLTFAVCLAAAV